MDIKIHPVDKSRKYIGITADADGMHNLQDALKAAANRIRQTREIFVIEGIYQRTLVNKEDNRLDIEFEFYPMSHDEIETTNDARSLLKKEGVGVSTLQIESRGKSEELLLLDFQLTRGIDQDNTAQLLDLAANALDKYKDLSLLDMIFTQHISQDGLAQPRLRVYLAK